MYKKNEKNLTRKNISEEIYAYLIENNHQDAALLTAYLYVKFVAMYRNVSSHPVNLVQFALFHMKKENTYDKTTEPLFFSSCVKLFKYAVSRLISDPAPDLEPDLLHHQSNLLLNFCAVARTLQRKIEIAPFFDGEIQKSIIALLDLSLLALTARKLSPLFSILGNGQHKSIAVIFGGLGKLAEVENIHFEFSTEKLIQLLEITQPYLEFMEPSELSTVIFSLGRLVEHYKNFSNSLLICQWVNEYIPGILSNLVTSEWLSIKKEQLNSEQYSTTLYGIAKLMTGKYLSLSPLLEYSLSSLLGYLLWELKIEKSHLYPLSRNAMEHYHFYSRLQYVVSDLTKIFIDENNIEKIPYILCFTALDIAYFLLEQNMTASIYRFRKDRESIEELILNLETRSSVFSPLKPEPQVFGLKFTQKNEILIDSSSRDELETQIKNDSNVVLAKPIPLLKKWGASSTSAFFKKARLPIFQQIVPLDDEPGNRSSL